MKTRKISEILEENLSRASVFEYLGIPYLKYLDETLEFVCNLYGTDVWWLSESLAAVRNGVAAEFHYHFLEIPVLVAYLKQTHHEYAKSRIPVIRKNLHYANLKELLQAFDRFSIDLTKHILLEEKVIFPFIIHLHQLNEVLNLKEAYQLLAEIESGVLYASHTQDDDEMKELKELTSNFEYKDRDPMVTKIIMNDLRMLEADIHIHAAIEDKILFEKARKAERLLREKIKLAEGRN